MLWGGLMMLLFWGAIIALIVWAVQAATARREEPPQTGVPRPPPLDIVKERYARGDISREEFERIKRDLEGT